MMAPPPFSEIRLALAKLSRNVAMAKPASPSGAGSAMPPESGAGGGVGVVGGVSLTAGAFLPFGRPRPASPPPALPPQETPPHEGPPARRRLRPAWSGRP